MVIYITRRQSSYTTINIGGESKIWIAFSVYYTRKIAISSTVIYCWKFKKNIEPMLCFSQNLIFKKNRRVNPNNKKHICDDVNRKLKGRRTEDLRKYFRWDPLRTLYRANTGRHPVCFLIWEKETMCKYMHLASPLLSLVECEVCSGLFLRGI